VRKEPIFPSDWKVRTLDEVSIKIQDGTHFSPTLGGNEYRYITSRNIGAGRLRLDSVEMISKDEHQKIYRRCNVRFGDLLLTKDGASTGNAAINSFHDEISLLSSVAFIRSHPQQSTEEYILQYLLSARGRKQIADAMAGNAITRLTLAKIKALRVPLPSVAEQRRIASTLRSADDLIVLLERLVAKKQAIKQGMMQQLLTGRNRLPGFDSAWTEVELDDLLAFKNGLNKGGKYFGLGTPIVNFMDVMKGSIITREDVIGRVTLTRDEIKRFSAKRGDLFFTRTSETVEEVGTAATLVDDVPNATFSGFILRGRPKATDIDSRFVAYLFQLNTIRQQVRASATYTTRALTNGRSLGRVFIRLPEATEQRAIADVIEDADREIALLRGRVDKARNVKQGMMQELLTGHTRLPVRKAAA